MQARERPIDTDTDTPKGVVVTAMSPPVEVTPSPEGVPGAIADPACVRGEDVRYPGAHDDSIGGYLAVPAEPAGEHGRPGILVIHHAGGLDAHTRDVTNRLANLGYVALAPDLFTREGGPPPLEDLQAMMARLFAMSDATVLGDLEGAADLLRAREDCDGKVGCIGFCMGGRYTLLLACASNRLDAAVDCWGGFIDAATPEQHSTAERPTPPLELADRLSCPLDGGDRRRGPQSLTAGGGAAACPCRAISDRYERARGERRRVRGRRTRVLRRPPPLLPPGAGEATVGADRPVPRPPSPGGLIALPRWMADRALRAG